jgi:hypothetical protein
MIAYDAVRPIFIYIEAMINKRICLLSGLAEISQSLLPVTNPKLIHCLIKKSISGLPSSLPRSSIIDKIYMNDIVNDRVIVSEAGRTDYICPFALRNFFVDKYYGTCITKSYFW